MVNQETMPPRISRTAQIMVAEWYALSKTTGSV